MPKLNVKRSVNRSMVRLVVLAAAVLALTIFSGGNAEGAPLITPAGTGSDVWGPRADSAQAGLEKFFWDSADNVFYSNTNRVGPYSNYWWEAHAMDALVFGYERTGDSSYVHKIAQLNFGLTSHFGALKRNYYDDMEWMALALLRSYEATGVQEYLNEADTLWQTIQGGWSENPGGGGFQWQTQGIYKNVAANAPACILACKLYQDFGDTTDLAWAHKIHAWLRANLVDSTTGVILDGITYTNGVGTPGYGSYSYNYGTYVGACVHLYEITKDTTYLHEAVTEADTAEQIFAGGADGIMKSEGTGDGGLFNGIFMYYFARLIQQPGLNSNQRSQMEGFLLRNADSLWNAGRRPGGELFNDNWTVYPYGTLNLSVELSGVTLVEAQAMINDSVVTSVKPVGQVVPRRFRLFQNFPNPFNPSTIIKYTIPHSGFVTLEIFNVLGQEVAMLVDGHQGAGSHEVNFNADRLASGAYFCVMNSDNFTSTKEMMLLK